MATIANTTEHAAEHVKEAASHVRAKLFDFSTQLLKLINSAREAEGRGADTLLHRLGLQRQRGPRVGVLWFAAGAVTVGTAVFLMTPAGKKLRRTLVDRLGGTAKGETISAPIAPAAGHATNGANPVAG
jgi:hypothetical protein